MFRYTLLFLLSFLLYGNSYAQTQLLMEDSLCLEAVKLYKEYRYDEAYRQYLDCRKALSESDTLEQYMLLLNAGICCMESADFLKAEKLFLSCKRYFSADSSSYHYIYTLNTLAILKKREGNYNESEEYLSQAIGIMRAEAAPDCYLLASSYNDRGVLCKRMGQYDRAIDYFSRSLELKYSCIPDEYLSIGISLNNLAGTYMVMKDYKRADSLYQYAILYKSTKLEDPNHQSILISWNNLAECYRRQGKNKEALEILFNVLERKKQSLTVDHPSYATTLHSIANLYFKTGQYDSAMEYIDEAIQRRTALLGKQHTITLQSISIKAKILSAREEWQQAWNMYRFIIESRMKNIHTYFLQLSESEKMLYLKSSLEFWHDFESFVMLLNTKGFSHKSICQEAYTLWLETRWALSGIVFRETRSMVLGRAEYTDSESIQELDELQLLRGKVSRLYLMNEDNPSADPEILEMEARISLLERKYKVSSLSLPDKISLKEVCKQVKSSECLIELVRVVKGEDESYMALVYIHGQKAPHMIPLIMTAGQPARAYSYYTNAIRSGIDDQQSYVLLWRPVEDYLKLHNVKRLYIMREGVYTLLNLNSIPDEQGKFLFERYEVHYINSIDAFLHSDQTQGLPANPSLFVLYRPAFCKSSTSDCSLDDLEGTAQEYIKIENVVQQKKWKVNSLCCELADEKSVRDTLNSFSVLHFATHGYYRPPQTSDDFIESMVKSGLFLAFSGETEVTNPDTEDGLLTAYEISQLNLSKVKLVVLSACETGLGKVDNQEGVLGLQRAFFVSGTNNVLVSLWKIDDQTTAQWMATFYGFLSQGYSVNESYLKTMQEIKKLYPRPYYWASFALIEG